MAPFSTPVSHDLDHALARGLLGFAALDADLIVRLRLGSLSNWLPAEGEPACDCPLLMNMEDALRALAREGGELILPSMRLPAKFLTRATISIVWSAPSATYVVLTAPDHASEQTDRLLRSERREKLLLQRQTEAAVARLRVSDALYRDLVESSGDLVLRFGVDRRVVFANQAAALFLGRSRESLYGEAIDALFPSSGERNFWGEETYAEQPASFELATRNSKGEVCWLWWDVRFSGIEAEGEFQAVARDVTTARRLRAEQDKAREEARAGELAAQRLRIAHDLHDTLVRSLVTAIMEIGVVAKTTTDAAARKTLREMQAQARTGLDEARAAIADLRARRERHESVASVLEEFRARVAETVDVCVEGELGGDDGLSQTVSEAFSKILREALRNIELHAAARHVHVGLNRQGGDVTLRIEDDGAGFDPERTPPGHFGLVGMRERAGMIGASLDISSAPGRGASVTVTVRDA